MTNASCFNCQHLSTWSFPGSREDPPDSGWDCGAKQLDEPWAQDLLGQSDSDEEEAGKLGQTCPAYEYFDWAADEARQAHAAASYS